MTCPVCNDDGVVTVQVYRGAGQFRQEERPCSAPTCVVANVNRLYQSKEITS